MPLQWTTQEREYGRVHQAQVDTPSPNIDYIAFKILNDPRTATTRMQMTFRDRWNATRVIDFEFADVSAAKALAEGFVTHIDSMRSLGS